MTPISAERLAEIRALESGATKGPWLRDGRCLEYLDPADGEPLHLGYIDVGEPADVAFIADARTAVPELLAEVERLRVELEQLRTEPVVLRWDRGVTHLPDGGADVQCIVTDTGAGALLTLDAEHREALGLMLLDPDGEDTTDEYGIRIVGKDISNEDVLEQSDSLSASQARLHGYRENWPTAVLMRRQILGSEWVPVDDNGDHLEVSW